MNVMEKTARRVDDGLFVEVLGRKAVPRIVTLAHHPHRQADWYRELRLRLFDLVDDQPAIEKSLQQVR